MTNIKSDSIILKNGMVLDDYLESILQKLSLSKYAQPYFRIFRLKIENSEFSNNTPNYIVIDNSDSDYLNYVNYDYPDSPEISENGYFSVNDSNTTMRWMFITNIIIHTTTNDIVTRFDSVLEYSTDNGDTWLNFNTTQQRIKNIIASEVNYFSIPIIAPITLNNALYRIKVIPFGSSLDNINISGTTYAMLIGIPLCVR